MLGLPGDTTETMAATIEYAARLNTQGAQFCITTPFPGTALFEMQKTNLLTMDYSQFNEYQPVVDIGTSTPEQILKMHAFAYRRFYLRWEWLRVYGASTASQLIQNAFISSRRQLFLPSKPMREKASPSAI
jgi:radical SAM superfamily enzyme YgiQ (UPF0313 family)